MCVCKRERTQRFGSLESLCAWDEEREGVCVCDEEREGVCVREMCVK